MKYHKRGPASSAIEGRVGGTALHPLRRLQGHHLGLHEVHRPGPTVDAVRPDPPRQGTRDRVAGLPGIGTPRSELPGQQH
jgi:hypothetical protein